MLSRALSLATVMLLIECLAGVPALAQNLEAGKSPSQIFASTCNACHKSPRGLLKTVAAGSLQGFLRQHYTTSPEMASLLSGFLLSNGAADTRYVGTQPKPGKEGRPEATPDAPSDQVDRFGPRLRRGRQQEATKPDAEPKQAAKPDADGLRVEPGRHGRNARRLARPAEAPDATKPPVEGQPQAASEPGPDRRKSAKQRLSKPGGEEPPKSEAAKPEATKIEAAKPETAKSEAAKEEPARSEAAKDKVQSESKSETAKEEGGKQEGVKPSGEGNSEPVKTEPPKEAGSEPVLRADPVPPVTPAPPAPAAVSSGPPEPAPLQSASPAPAKAPAETTSIPNPPPPAPAGQPLAPISQ
jgi:hypothetical protein